MGQQSGAQPSGSLIVSHSALACIKSSDSLLELQQVQCCRGLWTRLFTILSFTRIVTSARCCVDGGTQCSGNLRHRRKHETRKGTSQPEQQRQGQDKIQTCSQPSQEQLSQTCSEAGWGTQKPRNSRGNIRWCSQVLMPPWGRARLLPGVGSEGTIWGIPLPGFCIRLPGMTRTRQWWGKPVLEASVSEPRVIHTAASTDRSELKQDAMPPEHRAAVLTTLTAGAGGGGKVGRIQ